MKAKTKRKRKRETMYGRCWLCGRALRWSNEYGTYCTEGIKGNRSYVS